MKTLNIDKPDPPPMEVINVKDSGTIRIGHVTPIPSTENDMYTTSTGPITKEKRKRTEKWRIVYIRNEARTEGASEDEHSRKPGSDLNQEPKKIAKICDVALGDSLMFDEEYL